ncbi:MAG: hypothetical protein HFE59_10050 [Clostridiales bacterium]|nr:hypothetical protein [Clostridiales bacterium]
MINQHERRLFYAPKYITLVKPYKHRIGNVTFIVSSFGNQNTSVNAEDMLLDMIKNKILYERS